MKIIAISNPISGNKDLKVIKEELMRRFSSYDFKIWETLKPAHAIELAKKAVKEGADIVVAVGGDGTAIEVISGIIGSNAKLAIIPCGTGNMLAANLGIPTGLSKAIDIILDDHTNKIDVGKINGRYFAFMAGCGFDAKIIQETSREKKRKLGLLAYFIEGFKHAFGSPYAHFKIKLNNNNYIKVKALTVLIANSANIMGNIFSLAPHASFCDGLLDLIIISPKNTSDYIPIMWDILTKRALNQTNKIKHYQVKELEIESIPSLLIQADGDIIGMTPAKVQIIPEAVEVLLPKIPCNNPIESIDEHLRGVINYALGSISLVRF